MLKELKTSPHFTRNKQSSAFDAKLLFVGVTGLPPVIPFRNDSNKSFSSLCSEDLIFIS